MGTVTTINGWHVLPDPTKGLYTSIVQMEVVYPSDVLDCSTGLLLEELTELAAGISRPATIP